MPFVPQGVLLNIPVDFKLACLTSLVGIEIALVKNA